MDDWSETIRLFTIAHPVWSWAIAIMALLWTCVFIAESADRRDRARRARERALLPAILADPEARVLYDAQQAAKRAAFDAQWGTPEQWEAEKQAAQQAELERWKKRQRDNLKAARS